MIYDFLGQRGIDYERHNHPPVFTCEQEAELVSDLGATRTKNIFLRDRSGKRHFLIVVESDKRVDLKALAGCLGSTKLSLGSAERLKKHLGVEPGSVSLLALIHDREAAVELVLDKPIAESQALRCHPLVNTATLVLGRAALRKFLEATGHQPKVIDVPKKAS